MKLSIYTICLFLTICSMISCEKPVIENDIKILETKPILREGVSRSINTFNDNKSIHFNNPFSGLKLNDPEALAMVALNNSQGRKSLNSDEEVYQIYEIYADSIKLVNGAEGNEIYLECVDEIINVNDTWLAFADYDPSSGIILSTYDMEILTSLEIEIDSIFLSDTIPVFDANNQPWIDYGDTILFSADTSIFNDTLWIQLLYLYSDTLQISSDTVYSKREKAYKSLLLNTENGDLYDVGEYIYRTHGAYCDVIVYNESSNSFFFQNISDEICEVSLANLSIAKNELLYGYAGDLWGIVQNMIFYSSNSQFPYLFCQNPSIGLITKKNIIYEGNSSPILSSFTLNNSVYCWIEAAFDENVNSKFHFTKLSIRNDSLIFTQTDTSNQNYDGFIGILQRHIFYEDEEWFRTPSILWHYEESSSTFKYIDFTPINDISENKMVSDGGKNLFSIYKNKIIRFDLRALEYDELTDLADMEIDELYVGSNSNIYVEGRRFSDLNNIIRELDSETGEIINEWISENAPPESNISYLTKISNKK